jgi:hypothetical protein
MSRPVIAKSLKRCNETAIRHDACKLKLLQKWRSQYVITVVRSLIHPFAALANITVLCYHRETKKNTLYSPLYGKENDGKLISNLITFESYVALYQRNNYGTRLEHFI